MEGECEGAVTSGEGVTEIAGGVVRQWMNRLTTEGGESIWVSNFGAWFPRTEYKGAINSIPHPKNGILALICAPENTLKRTQKPSHHHICERKINSNFTFLSLSSSSWCATLSNVTKIKNSQNTTKLRTTIGFTLSLNPVMTLQAVPGIALSTGGP